MNFDWMGGVKPRLLGGKRCTKLYSNGEELLCCRLQELYRKEAWAQVL